MSRNPRKVQSLFDRPGIDRHFDDSFKKVEDVISGHRNRMKWMSIFGGIVSLVILGFIGWVVVKIMMHYGIV